MFIFKSLMFLYDFSVGVCLSYSALIFGFETEKHPNSLQRNIFFPLMMIIFSVIVVFFSWVPITILFYLFGYKSDFIFDPFFDFVQEAAQYYFFLLFLTSFIHIVINLFLSNVFKKEYWEIYKQNHYFPSAPSFFVFLFGFYLFDHMKKQDCGDTKTLCVESECFDSDSRTGQQACICYEEIEVPNPPDERPSICYLLNNIF